jgi:DNA-binding NarL/FixJ family response regulator
MEPVEVVIVTSMRLLGESLARCLSAFDDVRIVSVLYDPAQLIGALQSCLPDLVLFDVTQGVDCAHINSIAERWSQLPLLALGLIEQRDAVVNCGRAGFTGYVARDASIARMHQSILDAAAGRLCCPTEITAGLMRALHETDARRAVQAVPEDAEDSSELTRRENQVAGFIGRGFSNKEIARELNVSVATVKHHVHNILTKLKLPTRSRVARLVSDAS